MLPLSKKPEIIRLHDLEHNERERFISEFSQVSQDYLPLNQKKFLALLADIYFTYILICKCRRRLGQEYTYVAMYHQKHYEEEGVLMNKKSRLLMFLLQILQRHLIKQLFSKAIKILKSITALKNTNLQHLFDEINIVGTDGLFDYGRMFMLMLFLLGWNKSYNLVDTLLGTRYVYTNKNQKQKTIDYRIEGYLLLAVFFIKVVKLIISLALKKDNKKPQQSPSSQIEENQEVTSEDQICRICYDSIKSKSSTFCGHIFCWSCIVEYLQKNPECPICKSKCKPKQVVQLQNY